MPSAKPGRIDSCLMLLATLLGLALSPWVLGHFSSETYQHVVLGGGAEREALATYDAQTQAGLARFNQLALDGGDSAAEDGREAYELSRQGKRLQLSKAVTQATQARNHTLKWTRQVTLVLAFACIGLTIPAQLGKKMPPKLVKTATLLAALTSAIWMVAFIPDPSAGNAFHRLMAVVFGLAMAAWGLQDGFGRRLGQHQSGQVDSKQMKPAGATDKSEIKIDKPSVASSKTAARVDEVDAEVKPEIDRGQPRGSKADAVLLSGKVKP